MMKRLWGLLVVIGCLLLINISCQDKVVKSITVPMVLDHNRMLVEAEIQRPDGTWRTVRLWVDTGNPDLFISESLARDLGIELPDDRKNFEAAPLENVRIGGMPLDFSNVKANVMFEPGWLFSTMHNDANLPSTVMQRYQVIFDYPKKQFTIAPPETIKSQGTRVPASVNFETGIIQVDAVIAGDSFSFALDNGASYSFTSDEVVERLAQKHPEWSRHNGALGCANIWGWWPQEATWPLMRLPRIDLASVPLENVGIVGLPKVFGNVGIETWYSHKTARPVDGFLGPNAFKAFRLEIDYADGAIYFEKGAEFDSHDMDIVGLTVRQEADSSYIVVGVTERDGKPVIAGIEPGDVIIRVGEVEAKGATMGMVVDALRGQPGDVRILLLERDGLQFTIEAHVERFL